MADLNIAKTQIRKDVLQIRDELPYETRKSYSLQILKHFLQFDLKKSDIVSAFLPIRSEVDLRPIINALLAQSVNVCLPYILDRERIEFRQFDEDTHLVDNGFGTKAPGQNAKVLRPNIMLVPLSAFDRKGGRLGYGGGYYDRAIETYKEDGQTPLLIGVGFAAQEVEAVPVEPHDISLDMILTENGLRSF